MANAEERELESVIRETEAPSRTRGRRSSKHKVAKLTGRTISSLREKIKERKLSRSFDKYNKKYGKMRVALKEAEQTRKAQTTDNTITDSEVVDNYDIVASYNRRLAKYAVALLDDEIKRVVATQGKKPKALRVPRILPAKLRKLIGKLHDKRMTKKLQKAEVKEIKNATRDYIEASLEGALFKDAENGVLRDKIDAKVIKGLKLDTEADTFEDKIAGLTRFISADGETSVFDDEITTKPDKKGTNVPPTEPTSDVTKSDDSVVSEEELLRGLGRRKSGDDDLGKEDDSVPVVKTQPRVTIDELMSGLGLPKKKETGAENGSASDGKGDDVPVETTDPTKKSGTPVVVEDDSVKAGTESEKGTPTVDKSKELEARRKREISRINGIVKNINAVKEQIANTDDPVVKGKLETYLGSLHGDLDAIVGIPSAKTDVKDDMVAVEMPVTQFNSAGSGDVEVSMEPVEVKTDGTVVAPSATDAMANVTFKQPEDLRAAQVANPAALRITPQDLKNMEERNKAATAQVVRLRSEREYLQEQKTMYQEFLEQAKAAQEAEAEAARLSAENASLAAEVNDLGAQAVAVDPGIGRVKK